VRKFLLAVALAVSICSLPATPSLAAIDLDFSGSFTQDNEIVLRGFTVGTDRTVTVFSSSWDDGGLDPILAIWNASGTKVAEQDDGQYVGSTRSNGVWYDHGFWDCFFDVFLVAGDYTASVGQYDNFALGANLSDGFEYDGDPHFTTALGLQPDFNGAWADEANPAETDSNGNWIHFNDSRTSGWVFHILNVGDASDVIPEPTGLLVWFLLGTLGIVYGWRKRRLAA